MSALVFLTPSCALDGLTSHARDDSRPIFNFRGVPYASPPVGPLRFQAPEPVALWEGIRDAKEFGAVSVQNLNEAKKIHFPYAFPDKMSEDCLFLNIWSPTLRKESRLPVMVFIHGGSFLYGSGEVYDGTALSAHHNVVMVTINYRLGLLGFLFNEAAGVHGNMGLLDQIEAMRWIQKYISCFGGDPNNVTLFGESAGAISISSHILSPLSKGLFHRAICQSGTMLYPSAAWSPTQANKYWMKRLQHQGLTRVDPSSVKSFLSSLNPLTFVKSITTSCHVIDGAFLPDDPKTLASSGRFNRVPLLIGFNQCEGYDFILPIIGSKGLKSVQRAREIIDFLVTKAFYRGLPNSEKVVQLLMEAYVLSLVDPTEEELVESLVHLYGDLLFVAPSVLQAELHEVAAPTFLYEFGHRSNFSSSPSWCRAKHGEEIPFVLGEPFLSRFPDVWQENEKKFSRMLMACWAAFAKLGDPNNELLPIQWSTFDQERTSCILTTTPSTKSDHNSKRIDLWNKIIPRTIAGKHKL